MALECSTLCDIGTMRFSSDRNSNVLSSTFLNRLHSTEVISIVLPMLLVEMFSYVDMRSAFEYEMLSKENRFSNKMVITTWEKEFINSKCILIPKPMFLNDSSTAPLIDVTEMYMRGCLSQ